MKCPNCSAEANDAADCPSCGLVFAKWRERKEKEKREAAEALKALESPPPAPAVNPWTGRLLAALFVAWWLLGLGIYYIRSLRKLGPSAPPPKAGRF